MKGLVAVPEACPGIRVARADELGRVWPTAVCGKGPSG